MQARPEARLRVLGALAIVYLVWGSTYLAIKLGLEGFPPMGLGAVRFAPQRSPGRSCSSAAPAR